MKSSIRPRANQLKPYTAITAVATVRLPIQAYLCDLAKALFFEGAKVSAGGWLIDILIPTGVAIRIRIDSSIRDKGIFTQTVSLDVSKAKTT
jgi:hypothetical protein